MQHDLLNNHTNMVCSHSCSGNRIYGCLKSDNIACPDRTYPFHSRDSKIRSQIASSLFARQISLNYIKVASPSLTLSLYIENIWRPKHYLTTAISAFHLHLTYGA
ncbi:unnamed protein product [Periconia digitata]|uniref:Uncharacterized protein n=1 Tax=Periconia digitata TaxID=1303443 RepID=A0A9W4USK2_9PLEO|nr:unnamed protein product [Periconia digitata]